MNETEYIVKEVFEQASLVRFWRDEKQRELALLELKATLNRWLLKTGAEVYVVETKYCPDRRAVVATVHYFLDPDDGEEYLAAMQELFSEDLVVEKWEPELFNYDFELGEEYDTPFGLKSRVIKSAAPLCAKTLMEALALAPVAAHGPPRKGKKGKPWQSWHR